MVSMNLSRRLVSNTLGNSHPNKLWQHLTISILDVCFTRCLFRRSSFAWSAAEVCGLRLLLFKKCFPAVDDLTVTSVHTVGSYLGDEADRGHRRKQGVDHQDDPARTHHLLHLSHHPVHQWVSVSSFTDSVLGLTPERETWKIDLVCTFSWK